MELKQVVKKLQKFASPTLAEKWDNVGLLVEPTPPHQVSNILLINDLTEPVLEEALQKKTDLIISYHPPIFVPMKTLSQRNWKERIITKCVENRIAIYSPHTSHDAVSGGVNDWLISAFELSSVKPIENSQALPSAFNRKIEFLVSPSASSDIRSAVSKVDNVLVTSTNLNDKYDQISVCCCTGHLPTIMTKVSHLLGSIQNTEVKELQKDIYVPTIIVMVKTEHRSQRTKEGHLPSIMTKVSHLLGSIQNLEVKELQKIPSSSEGMGRTGKLKSPVPLAEAVKLVKSHLGLSHIRLASSPGVDTISSVAVCAGSGSSVLKNIPVSLYVTGEMSHHDVLHAVQSGTNVILCDHSNTERGFLKVFKGRLDEIFSSKINVSVSDVDRDPLQIV
ncbi:hypothetical protein FSP39_006367 [Pinctada imbricata]|uniref:NIF3-like protein 1 n=1 Tax=Pinctada imbricata TaxID=66713 RepID=A0AA88XEV9_PINIB|nr:hypothetical protein FSP39_006367 [Pinctada imbricata]